MGYLARLAERMRGRWATSRGQSIVEMALFFPILLAIMVSVVEVGNALQTYITVDNGAREGARLGAAGGDDADVTQVVTDTLDLQLNMTEGNTDVFVIRGTTSDDGASMASWEETHTYGAEPPASSGMTSGQVLEALQSQGISNTASMEFVATVTHHDLSSLLGVPLVANLAEMIPLSAFSVMPVHTIEAPDNTIGCDVYPIGVSVQIVENLLGNDEFHFENNVSDPNHFVWFYWDCGILGADGYPCPLKLAEYLSHPTEDPVFSREPLDVRIGDYVPGFPMDSRLSHGTPGCSEPADWAQLERVMTEHTDLGRTMLMIVFDHTATQLGSPCNQYLIVDFIVVYIESYNIESFEGHPDRFHTVNFQYLGDFTACGQQY